MSRRGWLVIGTHRSYLVEATLVVVVFCSIVLLSAQQQGSNRSGTVIDSSNLVDLTYTFNAQTIYWPNASGFEWRPEHWGPREDGHWYAAGHFAASEHGGTHLDAPVHFSQGGHAVDEVPVSQLVAPAVVIDISKQCGENRDYLLQPRDVENWEKVHGLIPKGSIALVRTGWGKFWPNKKQYMGTDVKGDVANLHFPGIGVEAAKLLASRGIVAVGIDTASMDYGQSKDFPTHAVINGANLYGLENVANLDRVPVTGAVLIALPMKIGGGSGAPTRIVAVLP
jgi:kynurenine formamidase